MTTSGSSPLTRGTLTFCNPPNIQCRFIPAYAGNSLRRRGKESVRPVHPRLRGELLFLIEIFAFCNGSSPLTRGTQTQPEQCFMNRRFIPAYAGNSRGFDVQQTTKTGSSPLTRGTRLNVHLVQTTEWFIPAYAGNSRSISSAMSLSPVHPRLRGELGVLRYRSGLSCGSSPLTRGTHAVLGFQEQPARFIPAYAGNSRTRKWFAQIRAVHPRLRGELLAPLQSVALIAGSSPLTRGTPD